MREGAVWKSGGGDVKRRIVVAVVFLLAGAVVNVAVAWGCGFATGSDAEAEFAFEDQLRALRPSIPERFRAAVTGTPWELPHPIATEDDLKWLRSRGWEPRPDEECVRWDVLVIERRKFGSHQRAFVSWPDLLCAMSFAWSTHPDGVVSEAGWPLRCLQDRFVPRTKGRTGYEHDSGLLVPPGLRTVESEPQYVATGVMLPTFLLNTLFYAAVLGLLA